MKRMYLLFAFAVLLGLVEALWFYPSLPDPMATHFGVNGSADGWGSRNGFYTGMGLLLLLIGGLFAALPLLFRFIPNFLISMPHRDYWLAPERRAQSLQRLSSQIIFFGAVIVLHFDTLFFLTVKANQMPQPALDPLLLWSLLGIFFAITIVWLIVLLWSFRRPGHPQ